MAKKKIKIQNIFSHAALVTIGANFLLKSYDYKYRCHLIVTEFKCCTEIPDIYGLRVDNSILIEVKTSMQDFKREKDKYHKQTTKGIGRYRYFLCETDIIKIEDLPQGWGLLYCNYKAEITVIKDSEKFKEINDAGEKRIMLSIIQRFTNYKNQILNFKKIKTDEQKTNQRLA